MMTTIADPMNSWLKGCKMYMQCRVTSSRILSLRSMTKEESVMEDSKVEEELEEMVEVEHQSLDIVTESKDTMPENVISQLQYVSIVNLMTILWKIALFYRGSGRIRDRSRKI
jgi:hypothetical protein